MISADLQPDQEPRRWNDHVSVYGAAFEPFTIELGEGAHQAVAGPPWPGRSAQEKPEETPHAHQPVL